MVQFNLQSSVSDMGPNTILKNKNIRRCLKIEINKIPTYNPYEIWLTTCYHSLLPGTIQFWSVAKARCRTWALILFFLNF